MSVILDGVAVDLPGECLGDVLVAATDRLEPSGRIIVEVLINGNPLVGDDLNEQQNDLLGDRELVLHSADPRELTVATLEGVRGQLDVIRDKQQQAADLLQADQPSDALQQFSEAIGMWLQTQQAVLHASQIMAIDLDSIEIAEETVAGRIDSLVEQLTEIKTMLTNGDTVGLSDALAYEWPQTVDDWDELIGGLLEQIESTDNP